MCTKVLYNTAKAWAVFVKKSEKAAEPECVADFPGGSDGKESVCNAEDLGSVPGLGRSPGEGKGYPLQYSGLENSTDCIVHGVTKSQTLLSSFHFQLSSQCAYFLLFHNFHFFSSLKRMFK